MAEYTTVEELEAVHSWNSTGGMILLAIIPVMPAIVIFGSSWRVLILVLWAASFGALLALGQYLRTKKLAKKPRFQNEVITFQVTDEILKWTSANKTIELNWQLITEWFETGKNYQLWENALVRIVPKHALNPIEHQIIQTKCQTIKKAGRR